MTRLQLSILRGIGARGAAEETLVRVLGTDAEALQGLVDGGYVWVASPDQGPAFCLSALGVEAITDAPALSRTG